MDLTRVFVRLLTAGFGITFAAHALAKSATSITVAKWSRFDLTLKSSVPYANPLQSIALDAVFVSPLGETNHVAGFWDGDKTWRVRFSPDFPGKWTYRTICSDSANTSLDNQIGEFTCTAALTRHALDRRGPIRVARDHRHFEHADRTPFLWLGDVAWNAARLSELDSWQLYSAVRASQKFTASHFVIAPGKDLRGETAVSGNEIISLNLNFFRRLDEKIEALNDAGLVAAIVPLQELANTESELPEKQAALLLRYAVARWGANKVAWILAVEGDTLGKKVDRWKRIGREVFGNIAHAPVILTPGETHWLLDEFRDEDWVDAFGFSNNATGEDALQWMLAGPLSVEWRKSPARPILSLSAPPEAAPDGGDARRMLSWSLLMNPSAGASYAATPIANWDTNLVTNPVMIPRNLPAWRNALFSPGARSIAPVAEFFGSIDFASLRPASSALSVQPGLQAPRRHVAAAVNEAKNLTLVYVPEDRAVELALGAVPKSPSVNWFNAGTGDHSPALAVLKTTSCQFATPAAGDWLLVLKSEK